jgi:hypothetical protein
MMFSPMIFAAVEPQLPLPTMHTVLLFSVDRRDFFVVDFFVVTDFPGDFFVGDFTIAFLVVVVVAVMSARRSC